MVRQCLTFLSVKWGIWVHLNGTAGTQTRRVQNFEIGHSSIEYTQMKRSRY